MRDFRDGHHLLRSGIFVAPSLTRRVRNPVFPKEVAFSGMRKTKRTPSALEEGVLGRGAVSGLGVILRTGLPERFVPWRRPCIVILTVAGLCRLHTGFLPSANLSITAKRGFSLSVALFLR